MDTRDAKQNQHRQGEGNMKRIGDLTLMMAALGGLLLTGCSQDTTGPTEQAPLGVTNEVTAMEYYAANDGFVANDEVTFEDKAVEPLDYTVLGKTDEAITPLRFGRFVQNIGKEIKIEVQAGDTIAFGHIQKTVTGIFRIRALKGTDTVTVEKPFSDVSEREIIFKRVARERERYWLNWVPVGTSLVSGGTVTPPSQVQLQKVEMRLPGGKDITITEPQQFFMRYRWMRMFMGGQEDAPELAAGETVTLRATVRSDAPDADIVMLRFGFDATHRNRIRMQLASEVNNGDGTYTRTFELSWQVHFHRGHFNAQIDAMTKGTLYDDAAPYSVSWWAVPYRVF